VLEANLSQNLPVVDRFVNGVATSIESIDLRGNLPECWESYKQGKWVC